MYDITFEMIDEDILRAYEALWQIKFTKIEISDFHIQVSTMSKALAEDLKVFKEYNLKVKRTITHNGLNPT